MSFEDVDPNEGSLSLKDMLAPDTPEVKWIKSLDGKEWEYRRYLLDVEAAIGLYYHDQDRNISDKDAVRVLRNIKHNFENDISYFSHPLEELIIGALTATLEEEPISVHEFKLVLDYVLWSIDNRSWMLDRQAYLRWICYYLQLYTPEEEEQYVQRVGNLAKKLNLSSSEIDMILVKDKESPVYSDDELESISLSAEFFAMEDDGKFNFLIENSPEHFGMFLTYMEELNERGEPELMKSLAKRFSKKFGDDSELYLQVAMFFIDVDPNIAKSYLDKALSRIGQLEGAPESTKRSLERDVKKLIKACDRKKS